MDFTQIVNAYLHVNNIISLLISIAVILTCYSHISILNGKIATLQSDIAYLEATAAQRNGVPTMRLEGTSIPNGTYGNFTATDTESTATLPTL